MSGANPRMDSEGCLDKDVPAGLGSQYTPVVVKGVLLRKAHRGVAYWPLPRQVNWGLLLTMPY